MFFAQSACQNQRLIESAASKAFDMQGNRHDDIERRPVDITKFKISQNSGQCRAFGDIASVFELENRIVDDALIDNASPGEVIKRPGLQAGTAQMISGRRVGEGDATDWTAAAGNERDLFAAVATESFFLISG